MIRSNQLFEALEDSLGWKPKQKKNKKSIEVGGLGVFDEPEVGSVAREKSEVASEDKQDETIGRSLEYKPNRKPSMNVKAREWRDLDYILKRPLGNSLVVQWLGLRLFTVGAWVQSLVPELRSLKPCDSKKI